MRSPLTAPVRPTSIVRRGLAYSADTLFLGVVYLLLTETLDAAFGPLAVVSPEGDRLISADVQPLRVALTLAVILLIDAGYFAGSWALAGGTPFQRLAGISVRPAGAAGEPAEATVRLEPGDALRRWAVMALLPLCAGLLGSSGALPLEPLAAFDAAWTLALLVTVVLDGRRRGAHDRVAGSIVVGP
jgi:RDD family